MFLTLSGPCSTRGLPIAVSDRIHLWGFPFKASSASVEPYTLSSAFTLLQFVRIEVSVLTFGVSAEPGSFSLSPSVVYCTAPFDPALFQGFAPYAGPYSMLRG